MSRLLVSQYQAEVERIIQYGGSRKETSIRTAFQNLLNEYCKTRDFLLIPELDYATKSGKVVYPDGTVKDALRLDWGYWESKDQDDNLEREIEHKLGKGYPDDNILFEDSQTAILIRRGEVCFQVSMRDEEALDRLLTEFINYERPEVQDFREAIDSFKQDLPTILESLRSLISKESESNKRFQQTRDQFLELCRESINPSVSAEDVREMIIQHILTEDIFINIFNESQFHRENNIARQLQGVIETFFTGSVKRNILSSVERYYGVIRRTAASICNHHEKQRFLKAVYEDFYKAYNPKAADRLGIVYTPNEIVRFMIESVDYLLYRHFGRLLGDQGVEILDPATGTGTYITELIEYLPKDRLRYKYQQEIHCNEVAILPYYIANLNIEFTYKQKMGEYEEFSHICFVDTLDHTAFHLKQLDLFALSIENTERIKDQNDRSISVIIGNPPYNAKQENYNQNNPNRPYKAIDARIKDTYVRAGLKTQRDEWVYDFSINVLRNKIKFLIDVYQSALHSGGQDHIDRDQIKWDRELTKYLERRIDKKFEKKQIIQASYRPYCSQYFYFDKHFNGMTYQWFEIFKHDDTENKYIAFAALGNNKPFHCLASNRIIDLHLTGDSQCLPLYYYDKEGNRLDNITDWGLKQFQDYYNNRQDACATINKEDIFYYTYAVLHNPAYRQKYEQNLKRDFPRLPLYDNFFDWVKWGKQLMDLHINYETVTPYPLKRVDIGEERVSPKVKLKADKNKGMIILDDVTTLEGIPAIAWEYLLGNRSALEWILDQYKEKKPKDKTIAEKFHTYRFADYKEQVIQLVQLEPLPPIELGGFWLGLRINLWPGLIRVGYLVNLS